MFKFKIFRKFPTINFELNLKLKKKFIFIILNFLLLFLFILFYFNILKLEKKIKIQKLFLNLKGEGCSDVISLLSVAHSLTHYSWSTQDEKNGRGC